MMRSPKETANISLESLEILWNDFFNKNGGGNSNKLPEEFPKNNQETSRGFLRGIVQAIFG